MQAGFIIIKVFVCLIFSCWTNEAAWAAPAAPGLHELVQPDGTKLRAVKWGDERRHGWETQDGYAIGFDSLKRSWHYLGKTASGPLGLLSERPGVEKRPGGLPRRIERQLGTGGGRVFRRSASMSASIAEKATGASGAKNVLVILVNFRDTAATYAASDFSNLIFGSGPYSMKKFYEESSYGTFTISPGPGDIAGWYQASQPHDYYGQNYPAINGYDQYPGTLVRETVRKADEEGFDFAPYDQDHDGYVDLVAIVHQGTGEEASPNANDIWSHSWSLDEANLENASDGGAYRTSGGLNVNDYIILPEKLEDGISTIGVFAHEYGHALSLPDLYDTDTSSSEGAGDWSVMAGGTWNGITYEGDRPAHFDAWCKYALGWVAPTHVTGTLAAALKPAATDGDVYQLLAGSPSAGGEYFLLEYRKKAGFDAALPGEGLLIWHVDESRQTNDSECTTSPGSPGCASMHYHVALMQADNLWNLERGGNGGDAGDPYPGSSGNTSFTGSSAPSSTLWSGAASGVSVTGIGSPGATITATFEVFDPPTTTTVPGCIDSDGDGYGDGCPPGPDCDDSDAAVHPGAEEISGDGTDNDCDADSPDDSGKCFFSAVLGPGNPRLAELRAFRDGVLVKSALGRAATRLYYLNADLFQGLIERSPGMKKALRALLEILIP